MAEESARENAARRSLAVVLTAKSLPSSPPHPLKAQRTCEEMNNSHVEKLIAKLAVRDEKVKKMIIDRREDIEKRRAQNSLRSASTYVPHCDCGLTSFSMQQHLENARKRYSDKDERKSKLLVQQLLRELRVEQMSHARTAARRVHSEIALALGRTKDKIAVNCIIKKA